MKVDGYAIGYYPVDLSSTDYEGEESFENNNQNFGVILTEESILKITNSDDTVKTVTLPAGIHPVQLKKIWKTGSTVSGSLTAFY